MAQDLFTGSNGTALTTHDSNWSLVDGSDYGIIYGNGVGYSAWAGGCYRYTGSNGNISEVTQSAGFGDRCCPAVRLGTSTQGYSINLGTISGENFTVLNLYKNNSWVSQKTGSWSTSVAHKLKVVACGTGSTVYINCYVDDKYVGQFTDSSSPYTSGLSGILLVGGADNNVTLGDDWSDNSSHDYNLTVTVKSSGGDYTSLNAALSGESTDLVTNTRLLTIETYAFEDTTDADTGTGYTVNSNYYIKITSPSSERHDGKWNTGKSRHKTTTVTTESAAIKIQEDYTVVEWQQIDIAMASNAAILKMGIYHIVGNSVTIRNNIVRLSGSYSASTLTCGILFGTGGTVTSALVYRNIVYDLADGTGESHGITFNEQSGGSISGSILNNTVYNCDYGISFVADDSSYAGTITVINNASMSAPVACYFKSDGGTLTSAKNVTSDATSPDGASYRSKTAYSDYFTDYANRDFHLKSTDTVLQDAGDNLGSPYNIDIDGQTVTGTWDIGADEYISTEPTTYTKTTSLDSYLQKLFSKTSGADAYLQKLFTKTPSIDAYVQKIFTITAGLDAYLQQILIKTGSLDAILIDAIIGSTVWGHVTGVTEENVRTFANHWTGTATIENTGDEERLKFAPGQYMVSEVDNLGEGTGIAAINVYTSGDTVTIKYRTGATKAACEAAEWVDQIDSFECAGYAQVRLEAPEE